LEINEDKVRKLCHELKKALTRLKALASLPQEEFVNDPDKVGSAKYHFIVAIEAAIDLCNHIITKNNYRPPEDYSDTFRVMGEAKIFDGAFVIFAPTVRASSIFNFYHSEVLAGSYYTLIISCNQHFKRRFFLPGYRQCFT